MIDRDKKDKLEKKLLHYMGKAIADYQMIQHGDRILVCLSGGKDSFTLVTLLHLLQLRANVRFSFQVFTLDQAQPGWNDTLLRQWLTQRGLSFEILTRDTYSIVKEKIPENQTFCSLCSRLRRGIIYRYAREHGFNKVALGHHRDDLIQTLLMSILYSGEIKAMPPKLLTDDKQHIVIRPLSYCQEKDIAAYALLQQYPIIPCNLCGSQQNLARQRIKQLIAQLALENPKVPSNILHALSAVRPSQLMDRDLWNFKQLEQLQVTSSIDEEVDHVIGH